MEFMRFVEFIDAITGPPWRQITWALVHFLWQGLVVAAAAALCLRLSRPARPESRYAICLVALSVMVACPVVTFFALSPSATESFTSLPVHSSVTRWLLPPLDVLQPCLFLGWAAGVLMLTSRLCFGFLGVLSLRLFRVPLPQPLAASVVDLGRKLGFQRNPRVSSSRICYEAMAVGFFRPIVLVPATWLTDMSDETLEAVIAHELAHLRRRDLWVNLAQRLVETLLFYHPAVLWLSQRIRLEREMCCDTAAVSVTGRPKEYLHALECVANRRLGVSPVLLDTTLGCRSMKLASRARNLGLR
jgi:D-alanyl-D-alanine endopeptidase (penicillin-binding protein 7)